MLASSPQKWTFQIVQQCPHGFPYRHQVGGGFYDTCCVFFWRRAGVTDPCLYLYEPTMRHTIVLLVSTRLLHQIVALTLIFLGMLSFPFCGWVSSLRFISVDRYQQRLG